MCIIFLKIHKANNMSKDNVFLNKKILITGNTGFKGSWLTIWLNILGAKLYGIALESPTSPSLFEEAKLSNIIEFNNTDIRDHYQLSKIVKRIQPDYIFHLAAQPLVRESYLDPIKTWGTNVMGTVNVLESLKQIKKSCVGIMITSDKCYQNQEWEWGYRECDKLGGDDPYSASKGSAELAINSYQKSFFSEHQNSYIRIASARAGNVIGGGDWADNRIVPDCIKAWNQNIKVKIKSPNSTRPFQHVLEPLSGYLCLAKELTKNKELAGHSFNFGPTSNSNNKVIDLVRELGKKWTDSSWEINSENNDFVEAKLLKLNCDKALSLLNWEPTLNFKKTMEMTGDWYFNFYNNKNFQVYEMCCEQIKLFTENQKKFL